MLGGDQWNYGQQIGCSLPGAEYHIANAADKRFCDIFDTMQLLLRREACEFCASVEFELETRSEEAGVGLVVEGLGIGLL